MIESYQHAAQLAKAAKTAKRLRDGYAVGSANWNAYNFHYQTALDRLNAAQAA